MRSYTPFYSSFMGNCVYTMLLWITAMSIHTYYTYFICTCTSYGSCYKYCDFDVILKHLLTQSQSCDICHRYPCHGPFAPPSVYFDTLVEIRNTLGPASVWHMLAHGQHWTRDWRDTVYVTLQWFRGLSSHKDQRSGIQHNTKEMIIIHILQATSYDKLKKSQEITIKCNIMSRIRWEIMVNIKVMSRNIVKK